VKPRVGETWTTDANPGAWGQVVVKRDYGDGDYSCLGPAFRQHGLFRYGSGDGAMHRLVRRVKDAPTQSRRAKARKAK